MRADLQFKHNLTNTPPILSNCQKWRVVAERIKITGLWCFRLSRVWVRVPVVTLVSLSKTLNHYYFVLRMGRKAVGLVCCVTHVKEPSSLIEKRRGPPRCSWFDWQHIAPQHLVNHYMVLCEGVGLILQKRCPKYLAGKYSRRYTNTFYYYYHYYY